VTTAVIVQARLGSTRLPGKVMADLAGTTVLDRVLERSRKISAGEYILAVPGVGQDAFTMAPIARCHGFVVWIGWTPEDDVLTRYYRAAVGASASVIVRITADCPLIDPEICERIIDLRRREKADYASNVWPRSFPRGLDCEVFTMDALEKAHTQATDPYDREHVTPWMVRNARRVNLASGRFDLARLRWTLDYPEDLEFLRALHAVREPGGMDDVLAILAERPELVNINDRRRAA